MNKIRESNLQRLDGSIYHNRSGSGQPNLNMVTIRCADLILNAHITRKSSRILFYRICGRRKYTWCV